MRSKTILVALMLLAGAPIGADARQVSIEIAARDKPQTDNAQRPVKTGTGRVRGRVTATDTGAVIRRAQVSISGPDLGGKTALTDAQGRYEFRDLPAGRFSLRVSKPGFLDMKYGQSHPSERGRSIELAEGQVLEKMDVALPRGGAISGRILDEFGDPVPDATVAAKRVHHASGKRSLVGAGRPSITNDLGTFRVFGLPPGEYYVTATSRGNEWMHMMEPPPGVPIPANNSSGFAATYYPNTPNPAEAQRIALNVGQEVSIDIQMSPVRLARIAGNAVSSDGKPISNAMVMLLPATMEDMGMTGMMGGGDQTDKDGKFTLNGVAPGEYIVQVQSLAALMSAATAAMAAFSEDPKNAPPPSTPNREFAFARVTVTGEDIAGLIITATRGAKASGRVIFEHGQKPGDLTSLRVMADTRDLPNIHMEPAPPLSALKENGTFEIEGLIGRRAFEFMNPPTGWFLKRITHEGTDVTDTGYDFKPGEDVQGFEIVLTTRSQTLTGVVSNDKGEAVKEYTVVVFPEDQDKWTGADSRWRGVMQGDQQGQFRFTDLPAGSYFAIALEGDAEGDWTDPEWRRRATKDATRFTLDEGGTKRLELKLSGS